MQHWMKEFHDFMKGTFSKVIKRKQDAGEIRTEADLQAYSWLLVRRFLSRANPKAGFRVFNQFRWAAPRIYPDLVILKRESPWVFIELKRFRDINDQGTKKRILIERKKLLRARQLAQTVERTYFVCLFTRKGENAIRPTGKKHVEIHITRER